LSAKAQADIEDFVRRRFDAVEAQQVAVSAIHVEFAKLARDPKLGTTTPGPFGRPVYTFVITVGGVKYPAQVVYFHTQDEKAIAITGFRALKL